MKHSVRLWSEQEFAGSRDPWNELLRRSDADPLFMRWEWQWTWWQFHRILPGAELVLLGVYEDDALIALAPLYLRTARHKGGWRARRLELIGLAWREPSAAFSEHLNVLVADGKRQQAVAAIVQWIAAYPSWDDLVFPWVAEDSVAHGVVSELCTRHAGLHLRVPERTRSYWIHLPARFEDYLGALSSNTRRRLFNHRERPGAPAFAPVSGSEWESFLGALREMRARRFEPGANAARERAFDQALASQLAQAGLLQLSELSDAGRPASLMYNVRIGATEYNLQSAFELSAAKGSSLGYLHLGYAIEAACRDGLKRFDLLAGRGLNREYKSDLGAQSAYVSTYQLLRSWPLRAAYAAYDAVRGQVGTSVVPEG